MNKPEANYFYVNRELLNSYRWLSEPFTRGQAWVDLFGLAQHTKGFFRVRGIRIDVERGQLAYSQQTLAKRWQWSDGKVKRYLNELEKQSDIRQQNNTITTVITILKYDKWQGGKATDGEQTGSRRGASKVHTMNDKNDKNDNNDKNTQSAPVISPLEKEEKEFNNWWFLYPKKIGKLEALKSWKKIKPSQELQTKMKNTIEKLKQSEQWKIENGRFIPNPATWLNQGRWDDEVSEISKITTIFAVVEKKPIRFNDLKIII